MAHGEASIHIACPPDEVFAFVGDATNNPKWRKNVVQTVWLDDGPMRVGRRGRQTARLLGRRWTVDAEVAEWDPPRHVAWRTVQGPVSVRSWIRVEAAATGSLVSGGADGGSNPDSCGDGRVSLDEKCDIAIAAGPGACPTGCPPIANCVTRSSGTPCRSR